ncbi:SixA phosphatase family protein [Flagellimonas allohymeniacidonis]|uniref:Histidine phosphatase family protein n=1 Tax=Flagellimonas allohymeniacidonis TaxID=2517819 RepID=A0A4Q8QD68_9FLAO|nr:histidine phosphatase family protein [Allomuricauda hymeniacidonis]TAI48311.1 histidine phosphatase family protein [Allomuricauda hymeniacidonis]
MKQIILMRHGKSSWEYDVSDKDRPLKERGIRDAHLVARKFIDSGVKIDAAFSSPANRALHTSMIFLRILNYDLDDFGVKENLYDFSGNSVSDFVKSLDSGLETIVIFGHNYAFTNLANRWGDQYIENLPTAGLVQIQFNEQDWSNIQKGSTKQIIFPKQLRTT